MKMPTWYLRAVGFFFKFYYLFLRILLFFFFQGTHNTYAEDRPGVGAYGSTAEGQEAPKGGRGGGGGGG